MPSQIITNVQNLPDILVKVVESDPYTRGKSDTSVSTLVNRPAYMVRLSEKEDAKFDVASRLPSILGQSKHYFLERAGIKNDSDVEQRLFHKICGWTVSGQYDLIEDGCIYDYKFTKVWSYVFNKEPKKEWTQQLNLLRFLAHKNNIQINKLSIIAVFEDFSRMKSKQDKDYPKFPVMKINIPVWELEETEKFLIERVKEHQQKNPPVCSDEQRWMTPEKWAVMKKNNKRAVKLFDNDDEAQAMVKNKGKEHFVQYRAGSYRRCEDYCDYAHVCPEFAGDF
tara:strand:+ start:116 stop:958 length:843 start_codon:yes stop_codon:yes gene_type:complete